MAIEIRKPTPDEEAEMKSCPIWEKEPSEFPWHYDQQETCLLIEGQESRAARFGREPGLVGGRLSEDNGRT